MGNSHDRTWGILAIVDRYDYIALVPLDFRPPGRHGRKTTPQALPALCVEDVHEPVLYGHDLDGALAFVRGYQDTSAAQA